MLCAQSHTHIKGAPQWVALNIFRLWIALRGPWIDSRPPLENATLVFTCFFDHRKIIGDFFQSSERPQWVLVCLALCISIWNLRVYLVNHVFYTWQGQHCVGWHPWRDLKDPRRRDTLVETRWFRCCPAWAMVTSIFQEQVLCSIL